MEITDRFEGDVSMGSDSDEDFLETTTFVRD